MRSNFCFFYFFSFGFFNFWICRNLDFAILDLFTFVCFTFGLFVQVSIFNFGDLADVHRTPVVTDASGWKGPAEIIDNTNLTRGTFAVRYQRDMTREVRLQDVRRHLDYLSLMAAPTSPLDAGLADWERVRTLVDESAVWR